MKLKNKNTGEIVELKLIQVNDKYLEDHEVDLLNGEKLTLKSLADSFDDVKEPLIKDEKISKAVRAWAEANGVGVVLYKEDNYRFYADDTEVGSMIEFEDMPEYIGLRHEHRYTIDELCGEEEE